MFLFQENSYKSSFLAVIKYHNFTEAAEACHISQSAISQRIKSLEQDLGV
ncbi:LysR family transcriptional regulator [Veillonella criceti]|nr:LysR family transcriptional regulator [Veillonella criceti]